MGGGAAVCYPVKTRLHFWQPLVADIEIPSFGDKETEALPHVANVVSAKLSLEVDRRRREAQPVTKRKARRQARAKKQVKRRVEEGNALGRERLEEKLQELAKTWGSSRVLEADVPGRPTGAGSRGYSQIKRL